MKVSELIEELQAIEKRYGGRDFLTDIETLRVSDGDLVITTSSQSSIKTSLRKAVSSLYSIAGDLESIEEDLP